ncbi:MAG: DUF5667 domain-containing protein, partial [Dehalococcoidia bacterium]
MARRFDDILDDCITRITLQGETVESCLALYPEDAAELEPELRIVEAAARARDYTPSAAAKDRGRLLLHAERKRLEEAEATSQAPRASWVTRLFQGQLRWAAAAAAVLVFLLGGGTGTVVAAQGSLPGDLLYPVKRISEQARLTFAFSEDSEAKLRLKLAERRAQEISKLVSAGRTSLLEPTEKNLDGHLATLAHIVKEIEDTEKAARLRLQLETSASQALAAFQDAVRETPETSRAQADDTFQHVSTVYGDAIEDVVAPAPEEHPAVEPGFLQFRVAVPLLPGVEQVLVKVRGIEAYRRGSPESRWVVVADEPQVFDLLRIAKLERFLGEGPVEPGIYTRVRFHIQSVTVVANGVERQARISNSLVTLTRPFHVESGEVTVVLLSFSGKSLLTTDQRGDYHVTP